MYFMILIIIFLITKKFNSKKNITELQNSRSDEISITNINDFIAIFDNFKEKINEQPNDFAPSSEVNIINSYDFNKDIDKCHVCGKKSKCLYFEGISCKACRDFYKSSSNKKII